MVVMKSKIFDALGVGVGLTLASIFTSAKGVVKNLNRSQAIVACSALTVLCGARRCRRSQSTASGQHHHRCVGGSL